ncbi:MAG TPA: amino acid adenylation domain-containing protein [Candidatus Angelobacter sp.]|nr:amino acid adenylation domain-containing protein [Candidatus Angelobacter sp.]
MKKDRLEEERELLRRLLEKEGLGAPGAQAAQSVAQEQPPSSSPESSRARPSLFPLSYQQEQLWFLERFHPGTAFYNVPMTWRIKGDLDVATLERSLQEVVRRHEILRTCFVMDEHGEPQQKVVEESFNVRLPVTDLRHLEPDAREEQAKKVIAEESSAAFDLSRAPLFRCVLMRMAEGDHIWGMTLHHSICDEWSLAVLMEELEQLYEAYRRGEESPLPELEVQYGDYALEQRDGLSGEKLQQQMEYWKKELEGMPQVLELPTDHVRPAKLSFRGRMHARDLESNLLEGLSAVGRAEGASLFMALLAAFQVLLMKYTGQRDFGVGTAIINRSRTNIQGLIGYFVNTLVIRADLGGELTFREILRNVRQRALSAYEHQDLPFEKLVEELAPDRDLSRGPLIQAMFTVRRPTDSEFGPFELSEFETDIRTSKFDLTMFVEESSKPKIALNYSTDLFEAETMERMLGHYERLLKAVVENPDQRIAELSLLTQSERERVLVEWNRTSVEYPCKYVHELFEEQVTRTPGAIAVSYEQKQFTYSELNANANRIAKVLVSKGIGPESLVGVCLERSLELVAVLLGVLKAGAGYVPLDPAYPVERLRHLVNDCKAAMVLCSANEFENLSGINVEALKIESLLETRDVTAADLKIQIKGDYPAYVIYTSGSTGEPKGVVLTHASLQNHMAWMQQVHPAGADDRVLQKTVFTFDASVWEFYAPLLGGGTLVMARPGGHQDPEYLVRSLQQEKITILQLVPLQLRLMLEQEGLERCHSLKRVYCGGEALTRDLVEAFYQKVPWAKLYNLYGPTECTIDATMGECSSTLESDTAPIGKPIANIQVYVLGDGGELVPPGSWGELHIGGAGLGRGYLNRQALTAESFIPNPFSTKAGERLYRTGDLVRWRKDGTIEFVGRKDYQVKVRGFRIELGEIEAILQQQSGVQGCAVVAKAGAGGTKRLVAYVVGERNREELRRDLKGKLPAYMIPNAIMRLQELPLTRNGKLDRQALEKLEDLDSGDSGEYYKAPCTAVEEQLAEIWAAVLEVTRVGRHGNFFDLGGHSLLAVSMASRCRNVFGLDVPVRAIFESPTIAELAEVIELELKSQERKPGDDTDAITTQRSTASRPSVFPLSYQQEQLWFLDQFQPGSDFYNVPLAWKLKGNLDVPTLERSLREVVRRHEQLRTCFVMDQQEGLRQKVVAETLDARLPVMDLRHLAAGEREKQARNIIEGEGKKAFDLTQAPLWRGVLVRTEEKEHVLGFTVHHILCDDWSWRILMSEWGRLYEAYEKGDESPLPELKMQYGEYALEQRERLSGGKFQQQMDYWKGQLKGMPQILELPTDHMRPARESFRGATEQRILGSDLFEGLNAVGKGERASFFMTVLAACQVLLMRYTGQEDFGVGTVVSNRKRAEMEPIFGFFLNTLVIRANLGGEPTFREVLQRVRAAALAGYEHQEVSFEKLVEELAPDRDGSRTPIFQVLFTTLGEPDKLGFGELELNGFEIDTGISKFDLVVSVQEATQGAAVTINYSIDLFEAETIQRMLGHYEQLLKAVVANPEQPVWKLPLLTEAEMEQLASWNQTSRDYPRDKTPTALFEEHAARTPNAVAVEHQGSELRYGDLNRQANRLAHHLRALGVKPDTLVAVCVDRGLEMIVGLLAVMKAGGAYVPLDPAYPQDRLQFMLEDSRPAVLLTQSHLRALFTEIRDDLKLIDLESAEAWSHQPDSNPEQATIGLTAKHLVYVIFTSGSTGQPKGVAMPVGAAMNMIAWQMNESAWAGPQRTLQFAPFGFDVSFQEIFSTLCAGGTLLLIDEEKRRNATEMARYVMEKGVQRLFLPVVGMQMFAEGVAEIGEPFDCALREINVAGEQLRINDKVKSLFKRLGRCRLNNHYGPTETHAASAFHMGMECNHWPLLPPIGRPIANAQIYILDKHEQFVPVGVAGELYIGGAGVARGYLNRPDLTEKRFLKNRFTKEDGSRIYRSGDLGRWRADGTIEFIGRNDSQVKIRGYRVELGEIEAILQQQSGVRGCAVMAKPGANGSKRLVAYVVGERDCDELRRNLKGKLPAYMVPSAIVALPELPLSGNGKVDREALEKREDLGPGAEHYEPPANAAEKRLAAIWAEALGTRRVGRHDNFFDLGGHSLLATLVATRMGNTFGTYVPVRALFESPTIAELAEVIKASLKLSGREPASDKRAIPKPVVSGPRPSLFPLSYQQEQLWVLDQFNPGNAFYNIPMTWRLKGDLDVPRLERSLREVVRRHEILRTCFVMEHGAPRQKVVGATFDVLLPVVDLRQLEPGERLQEAKKVVAKEAGKAFELSQAPLLRAVLARTDDREHVFGLTLHHIICDDWSLGLLVKELGRLYEAFGRGEESPLPELEMQYGEYALEQREALSGGKFQQQMDYWKKQLEGMPQVLELPTDHVRPARESFRGASEQRILPGGLLKGLNALGRAEKASLLMTMLAAFQVLLMRYSGQEDFGVGTVVANRKRIETKELIGFFLNTLVIRANLGGDPIFRKTLRSVRESVLGGYENQDLAFEKLVEELAPVRDVSRSPVFQVAFTLRRSIEGKSDLGGLEMLPFELDPGTSKFDLIMGVEEAGRNAVIGLNYSKDLFEAETIRHMLEHYERLLEGIVADADQPVWALPMMSELDEKAVSGCNSARPASPEAENIVEVLEAQAESRPQEPAAIFGETQLSYGELNSRASQVGRYLVSIGVRPESLVGIFMPPCKERLVAILGVLKAGGAWLPLDVVSPKNRLRSIIDGSEAAVLLTLEALRKRLPQSNARLVCLDSEWEMLGQHSATNPEIAIDPRKLAFVIYTGAQEGRAKALMLEHGALMGIVPANDAADTARQNGHAKIQDNSDLEIWRRLTSSSFLVSTSAILTPVAEEQRNRFAPRGNAEIYLLDPHLQRVAIGVPGELWIGGDAAGRGYLGRALLTAEKFLPNPFTAEMGGRMRGTGERARYKEDGTIELMGRLDDRIEIEGVPVELGEIEATLANHESVREAVVVVRPSGDLVAYVVVREGKRLVQNEVRSYLDERLPLYMIPGTFITVQELPRNARGEVDRAALSALGQEQLIREFVLPRTELEKTLAAAWQAALGIDQVGVYDNFFDLGGNSLRMIQIHQKLRAELSIDIDLLHLFQFPSIDSLVRFLQAGYNFDGRSRETRDRAGRQKSAIQKLKRTHTP